jgi:polyphosphate kinase
LRDDHRLDSTDFADSSMGRLKDTDGPDLRDPALYINRELGMLEFNVRVLDQAKDPTTPLLERLRFLSISSTNLDEFFEIRVAGLRQLLEHQLTRFEPDGMTAAATLEAVSNRAHALVADQYRVLNDVLMPELEKNGIHLLKRDVWSGSQREWIEEFFRNEVMPVLTPVGLDPAHPFPRIQNKSLNFAVTVTGTDAFGRDSGVAIVQVPRSLPRVIKLPAELQRQGHGLVLLSSIVHAHIEEVFPGMRVTGCYQFRVTRNSDLWVDEEEADDLMRALKGELPRRKYGDEVRLEVADTCPSDMAQFLLGRFELRAEDLYRCPGPVNLNRMAAICDLVDRPNLKYPVFIPRLPPPFEHDADVFEVLRGGDVLLHHPYDSFSPVVELVRQASRDPNVLAIKQTLYRTGSDSPIVDALIDAARAGKEVTVLVELRARFDEEENITLATRLQEAGAKVAYGIVGYKTHAKMLLIVRREGKKLRRYVHLGTGNYHSRTAQLYTDIGLLSCEPALGNDVHQVFNQLTGLGAVRELKRLFHSPFTLREHMLELIAAEAKAARKGKPARIVARMNALTEPTVIQALYEASNAGVDIDLIVRGICGLRPGVPGVSENIRVRSIIGRLLEHSRVFYFHAGGQDLVYCSSADWMQRNLRRRVEICFPIDDPTLKARVIDEALNTYLDDNTQSFLLQADGYYRRQRPGAEAPFAAQSTLLARISRLAEFQGDAERRQRGDLDLEVGAREGVPGKPVAGKGQPERFPGHDDGDDGRRPGAAAPVETNGKSKKHAKSPGKHRP